MPRIEINGLAQSEWRKLALFAERRGLTLEEAALYIIREQVGKELGGLDG